MQEINLIPSRYLLKEKKKKQLIFTMCVLVISLFLAGGNYSILLLKVENYKKAQQLINERWKGLQDLRSEIEREKGEIARLQKEEEVMKQLLKEEGGKVLLDAVCRTIPEGLWLKEIYSENLKHSPAPAQTVSGIPVLSKHEKEEDVKGKSILILKGEAESGGAVAELLAALEESGYFIEPRLEFITSDSSSAAPAEEGKEPVKWTINCNLR